MVTIQTDKNTTMQRFDHQASSLSQSELNLDQLDKNLKTKEKR